MSAIPPNAAILHAEDTASGEPRVIIPGSRPTQVFAGSQFAVQRLLLPAGESTEGRMKFHTLGMNWGEARSVDYVINGHRSQVHIPPRSGSFFPAGCTVAARWSHDSDVTLVSIDTCLTSDLRQAVFEPIPVFHSPAIDRLVRIMSAELAREDIGFDVALGALADLALIEVLRLQARLNQKSSRLERLTPRQVKQLQDFIHGSLNTQISLTELAKLVNLSVSHFARAFRASIGVPPARYIRQQRLEQARQLLISGEQSIQELASRYGFASASHFAELFRIHFGMSPREYRRRGKS